MIPMMIPLKTPILIGSARFCAADMISSTLISTTYPTTAARPETASPAVNPMATPTAKIRGRFSNTIRPPLKSTFTNTSRTGLFAKVSAPASCSMIRDRATMSPAAGSTDTGSISDFPTFCKIAKNPPDFFLVFIRFSSFSF